MKQLATTLTLALALLAGTAWGDVAHYKQVAATATAQTVNLGSAQHLTIYNAGGNEVYFRLFAPSEDPIAAVATAAGGVYLASGATLSYPSGAYGAISIICDAAETATVHLYLP